MNVSAIQANVAASFRIPRVKMTEPLNRGLGKNGRNAREYSLPRQVSMYLCRQLTEHSLTRIGHYHGGRDHSTVLFAIDAVEKLMAEDDEFARKVNWNRYWLINSECPRYPQGNAVGSSFVPCREEVKVAA